MSNERNDATRTEDSREELLRTLEFETQLNQAMEMLHSSDAMYEVMPDVLPLLLKILESERVTVYQKGRHDKELISRFKIKDELSEIRVPLSSHSISGFVALSQRSAVINDVYDEEELRQIHPHLSFNNSFDRQSGFRTRSMIVVPIKYNQVMLGVLQLINHTDGKGYRRHNLADAHKVAKLLGQKLRYEFGSTSLPFGHLVQRGLISAERLRVIESESKHNRLTVIQKLRVQERIPSLAIGASLEHYHQVPFMAYNSELKPPHVLMKSLNEAFLRNNLWVPVSGDHEKAVILIDDPSDVAKIEEVQQIVRAKNFVFYVGLPDDILRYLGEELEQGSDEELDQFVKELSGSVANLPQDEAVDDDVPDENEAVVVQLVNRLILEAFRRDASDIHIEPSKPGLPAKVRIRVDGVCRPLTDVPGKMVPAVTSRIKVMSRLDITERRKPQDGKLMMKVGPKPLELRVATLPTVNGEEVVMRILAASEPLPIAKLNLSGHNHNALLGAVAQPHGIFLVVGPTGSGKTTTLHAILGHINTPERKIWTAEDPVEITQEGLRQLQVNTKIGLTFAAALRSFLRADPDVIMIGEMRDGETAHAGVEASLTGHYVFSTLHTNSAAETIVRLLDMGVDRMNFSDALRGILAQRLVRTLCPKCRSPYPANADEMLHIERYYGTEYVHELELHGSPTLYRANGCDYCSQQGYRGRTGLHELLTVSTAIQRKIYNGESASAIRDQAMTEGMRTLRQDGVRKLLGGQIDFAQLQAVAGQ